MRADTAGNTDVPLPEETIGHHLDRIAARVPFHDALVEAAPVPGGEARRWSFTKLNDDADRLARALLALGTGVGERVGIWSPNCAEWTLIQFATAKAGAVLVGVDADCSGTRLEQVLESSGIRLLLAAPSDNSSDYVTMARDALARCPDLEQLVFLPDQGVAGLDAGIPLTGAELSFAELLRLADRVAHTALEDRMAGLTGQDPAILQFPAGAASAGGPREAAALTHSSVLAGGYALGQLLEYSEHDRIVLPVPLHQEFGLAAGNVAALCHGAATILPARRFSPSAVLEAVQDFGGTSLYGTPAMFAAALDLPDFASYDLSSLRTGVVAGALDQAGLMSRIAAGMKMEPVRLDDNGHVVTDPRAKEPGEPGRW